MDGEEGSRAVMEETGSNSESLSKMESSSVLAGFLEGSSGDFEGLGSDACRGAVKADRVVCLNRCRAGEEDS